VPATLFHPYSSHKYREDSVQLSLNAPYRTIGATRAISSLYWHLAFLQLANHMTTLKLQSHWSAQIPPLSTRRLEGLYYNLNISVASSPGSPIFFNARKRKEGEPGIHCHVRDVGPYARVGRVADRENCAWVSTIFMRSGSV
jgi:hypothetical protein